MIGSSGTVSGTVALGTGALAARAGSDGARHGLAKSHHFGASINSFAVVSQEPIVKYFCCGELLLSQPSLSFEGEE